MVRSIAPAAAVAVATFALAVNNGAYEVLDRTALGVAVWWAVGAFIAVGVWPRERPPGAALVAGAAILALAGLSALSIGWSDSAEKAFAEVDRIVLYLGAFALVVLATRRGDAARWSDGLAIGIAAVGVLALVSDLYPDVVGPDAPPTFFPAEDRLSWPLNYWNGLGILVGMAFPLLLRAAVAEGPALWRAAALAPVPPLTATIYLTSSRGAAAAAIVGVIAFMVLTNRRLPAFAAFATLAAGSAATIAVLVDRKALADAPVGSAASAAEADSAALLIVTLAVCAALAYWAWCSFAEGRIRPRVAARAGLALLGVLLLGLAAGAAAADPVERFEDFKRPPREQRIPESDFTKAHLLNANGSGRWQIWESAADQYRENRWLGHGAGSFEAWWAENGEMQKFVRDAHSLYLETMGELGLAGLAALLVMFGAGFGAALTRALRGPPENRVTIAALAAVLASFAVAAAIDWMWELTVVALVAVVCLGLLTGPATARARGRAADQAGGPPDGEEGHVRTEGRSWHLGRGRHFGAAARAGMVALAVLAVWAQGVVLLSQARLQDSQAAASRGDRSEAVEAALDAKAIQPFAASPYLQLALLDESDGDLRAARARIGEAIDRDPADWRLWLVAARLEARAGNIPRAKRDLDRARTLNPRSPLFAKERNAAR